MPEPAVVRVVLLDQQLPSVAPVAHVEVRRITMESSVPAGAHRHNGPVFGVIERGSAVIQVEDGPEVVLHPGDVFFEPADVTVTRFDSTEEGVVFLGYFLLGADQEPAITLLEPTS